MKKSFVLILTCFAITPIFAQVISAGTIASFAGSVSNSTITIDYSVGENAISTISGPSNSITQGFLQPQLVIATGIIEVNQNNEISIFPNPTSDFVNIKSSEPITWTIYDEAGRVILSGDGYNIDTKQFAQGIYYLNLTTSKNDTKLIKLIKN